MVEYDEVSGKLGGIEATQNLILKSVYTMEGLFKDMSEKVILQGAASEAANKRMDGLEPRVEALEDKEQQRTGAWKTICTMATVVGAAGGVVGTVLARVFGIH